MAHEIETVNGKARMIYRGAKPWHDLGTQIPMDLRLLVDQALAMADMAALDVQLQRLSLPDGRPVDCYAAVRRDGKVVGAGMGVQYRIVQLEDAFAPADALIKSGLASIETVGSLKEGSRAWMLLKVNRPDAVIVAKSDDRVAKYLLIATSFDGSLAVVFEITGIRVVCQNTLSMALNAGGSKFKIRHTRSATTALDAVTDAIERADKQFELVAEMFRALAKVQVNEAKVRAYIDAVFPPPPAKPSKAAPVVGELIELPESPRPVAVTAAGVADFAALLKGNFRPSDPTAQDADVVRLVGARPADDNGNRRVQDNVIELLESGGRGLDLPGVKGTAWGAYNAVTEYLTWERGRSDDNRLNQAWFGDIGKRALTAAADTFLAK